MKSGNLGNGKDRVLVMWFFFFPFWSSVFCSNCFESVNSQLMKNIMAESTKKKTLKLLPTYGNYSGDKHNSEDKCYELPVSSGSQNR